MSPKIWHKLPAKLQDQIFSKVLEALPFSKHYNFALAAKHGQISSSRSTFCIPMTINAKNFDMKRGLWEPLSLPQCQVQGLTLQSLHQASSPASSIGGLLHFFYECAGPLHHAQSSHQTVQQGRSNISSRWCTYSGEHYSSDVN